MPQLFIDSKDTRAIDVARGVRKRIEEAEAEEAREQAWEEQKKQAQLKPWFQRKLWNLFYIKLGMGEPPA